MENDQRERLIAALLQFVERASKPEATTAEVEALAAVAQVLLDIDR